MEVRESPTKYASTPHSTLTGPGELPVDWRVVSVKEIAAARANAIVGGPFGSDLVAKDYVSGGVPVIRGQNMAEHYISGDFAFVSKEKAKNLQANTARAGDVIFTQRGTLGQVSLIPDRLYEEFVVSQSQMKLTLNSRVASAEYIYQYFVSSAGQRQIADSAIQTGVPHTNLGILKNYLIPVPPTLHEQEVIAEALSDADALIESLSLLLAKKRKIKQGAMQELLTGKRRLPGFTTSVPPNHSEWPTDWRRAIISQIADVKTGPFGSALHEEDYVQSGIPIVTVEHIGEHGIDGEGAPQVSASDAKRLQAYTLRAGDIVFSRVGSIDRSALVRAAEEGWLFSGRLLRLRTNSPEVSPRYLGYLFQSERFKQKVLSVAVGQTMASLNTRIVNSLEVRLPSLGEQEDIAQVLFDMEGDVAEVAARLAKARDLKQGMMQALLTGRIRLMQPASNTIPIPA